MTASSTPREHTALRLARWANDLTFDDLPAEVIAAAQLLVLDQIGVQVRGSTLAHVRPQIDLVQRMQARSESTITQSHYRTVAPYAAFVNGTLGHSAEFDDSHMLAWHAGSVVVPTAIAFAEREGASGKDVITAIVAGQQVMSLLGSVMGDGMQRRGWHGPKVMGGLGAAATAGRILKLDAPTMAQAFAVAASDASGTMEYDHSGGEVKRMHAGSAARSGSQAALLAQGGVTGPPTILEGAKGLFAMFGDTTDHSALESAWGRWHILDTAWRLYPAIGTAHSPLDAIKQISTQHEFEWADISEIRVGIVDFAVDHGGSITRPTDAISAQFSIAFSIGLLFVVGENRPQDYIDPAHWTNPDVLAVVDLVHVYAMEIPEDSPILSSHVSIVMKDGRTFDQFKKGFRGHPEDPASHDDIEHKFRRNVDGVLPENHADLVIESIQGLPDASDVSALTTLMAARLD